ncbi:MAG: helix-turn-helix transcriptional regulator [Clostridiales bacterium]|nr:helix-turn-helix transcriptional regulator [Clostridiales bacterium]
MNFINCSPFVRFIYEILYTKNNPTVSRDCRLFYILEGEGKVKLNNKEYSYSPSTVILLQAGNEYLFTLLKRTKVISINFDLTYEKSHITSPYPLLDPCDKECALIRKQQITFKDCPALNEPIVCLGNTAILNNIKSMLLENASCQPYYRERISSLMKDCLFLIARAVLIPDNARCDNALQMVLDYIHENYHNFIDNTVLADVVGYHPYYLNKIFSSAIGVTLHKYVTDYRINISEQLLLSSSLSIEEIALKTGFNTSLSFLSAFKKKNSISPSEFRKKFGATI